MVDGMGWIIMGLGIVGMAGGLFSLLSLKDIPLAERKRGLIIFAGSLVLALLGYLLHAG